MKTKNKTIKIGITINDEEYRCGFKIDESSMEFHKLTKAQQIEVCNSFLQMYELFAKAVKNK